MTRFFYLVLAVLVPISWAHAATMRTVASNYSNPDAGFYTGFSQNDLAANSFTTGSMPSILNSATLRLHGQITTVPFIAFIYADEAGHPSELISQFENIPFTFAAQDLTFVTSTPLAANTRYWLAATTLFGDGGWAQVDGTGMGLWSIGGLTFSSDAGVMWIREITSRSNQFSLTATIVPEPATLMASLIAFYPMIRLRRYRQK